MNHSTQTILYVMRHIDSGGFIDIPYKKIGITGMGNATLSSRIQQISTTKSPIKAQCIAAWKFSDARKVEIALHSVLSNDRVEGEWFYDKNDDLIERIMPVITLLDAERIQLEEADDSYSKNILAIETETKTKNHTTLIGEISEKLHTPLRSSVRINGPSFFSDKTKLTYYINVRKSGHHNLNIDRSKEKYGELATFLDGLGFSTEQHERGHAMLTALRPDSIADIINQIEEHFR